MVRKAGMSSRHALVIDELRRPEGCGVELGVRAERLESLPSFSRYHFSGVFGPSSGPGRLEIRRIVAMSMFSLAS